MKNLNYYVEKAREIHSKKNINSPFDLSKLSLRCYSGNGMSFTHYVFERSNLNNFDKYNQKYCFSIVCEYLDDTDLIMFEFRENPNEKEE